MCLDRANRRGSGSDIPGPTRSATPTSFRCALRHLALGATLISGLCLPAVCRADLLANGGFETPVLTPGTFVTINPGSEPADFDWEVSSGTVDIGSIPLSQFIEYGAFAGVQALDLNGTDRGALFQDFATTASQTYRLTFVFADNAFEGGTSTAEVIVSDVASTTPLLTDDISHSTSTNGPPADADWDSFSQTFTATGSLSRLSFTSTSPSNSPSGGIVLDAVSVALVPEPGTLAALSIGIISLACRTKRSAQ